MTRKIIKFILTSILIICLGAASYYYFKPKEAAIVADNYIAVTDQTLTYANIESDILADNNVHYLWLCDMNNNDCIYTRDYIIKPLAQELGVDQFDSLEFVDFNEAPDSTHYMSSTWGFNNFPAFVAVQNVDGKVTVLNYLAWDKDNPFDSQDLKTWMYNNGIWTGVYEITEKIAPALNQ